jgi:hypothetical protein
MAKVRRRRVSARNDKIKIQKKARLGQIAQGFAVGAGASRLDAMVQKELQIAGQKGVRAVFAATVHQGGFYFEPRWGG